MKYEVLNDKRNEPMKRKELKLEFDHSRNATISKAMVQKSVAQNEKVPATHVFVDNVVTKRGTTKSVANVDIYNEPVTEDLTGGAEEEKKTEASEEKQEEKTEEASE